MRKGARFGAVVGPLLVVMALSKVHAAWVAVPSYDYTGSFRFAWSLAYALALIVAAYGLGLPDAPRRWGQAAIAAIGSSVAAAIMVSLTQLVLGDALLPRFVVLSAAVAVVPLHVALWAMSNAGRGRAESRDRVVVVAGSDDAAVLEADLASSPERPVILAEWIDTEQARLGVAVAGVEGPLLQSVLRSKATVVVIGRAALADETVVAQAAALHEAGVRVRTLLQFYEEWLGKLPVGELERASLFFDISELHRVRYGRVKRMVDVAGALVGMIPLVISLPFVLVGNLVGNRGQLLYKQKRVGRGGHEFEILKFRTMVQATDSGKDDGGTEWTTRNDPRITKFGGLLRTTHLDELPQMINILRGDLSLVGPRPEQPRYVVELSEKLPFYGMRHLVRPGLTGWAQVKYGYAGDERDSLEKLQYEFFYLRHQSLRFDARVLARTIRSMTGGEGAGR
ncbi:MAG: sugar transferase [Aquihabitans sp.]